MKKFFILTFFVFGCWICANCCTMVPSVWKSIDFITEADKTPTMFALIEAFSQIKNKFLREMRVSRVPVKPFFIRSIVLEGEEHLLTDDEFKIIKDSTEFVFENVEFLDLNKYINTDNPEGISKPGKYSVDLYIHDSKSTQQTMIDLNLQFLALLKTVMKDEVTVFARISDDKENLPIFVDEFEVSPTIITTPLISPIGGFFTVVEKNTIKPLHIDWGTTSSDSEHHLRVTTQYYEPSSTPPLEMFQSELSKMIVDEQLKSATNDQLIYAIKKNDFGLFELVFDSYDNIDLNVKNSEGKVPLHYAVVSGNIDFVKVLLEKKSDVNIASYEGETSLHIAVMNNVSATIVSYLIEHGADVRIKNNEGKTPLDLAKEKCPELLKVMESKK